MDITLLSDVRPGVYNYVICVRVSRIWEFHGKNDEEPIKHLDLVVIDQKGTSMYAEIPADVVPILQPQLEEGKILYMKKISIERAKPSYKPVRSSYMIKLNKRTQLIELTDQPSDFPKYTFFLMPFSELHKYERNNEYFIDVIGRITAVSDVAKVTTSTGLVRAKRVIHLTDQSANKIEISLWGPRAEQFQGQEVYEVGQKNHVIAIFVGTSVKSYQGSTPFLSGTAACRWYINLGEISEITIFYTSIYHQVEPVQKIQLQTADEMQNQIQETTLLQLKSIDPFENLNKRFECTFTVTKLAEKQSWCYPACTRCNAATKFDGTAYVCNKEGTVCSQIIHRYKICLIGTDGTCELQFMLFDERGVSLIGKPAEKLVKQYGRFDLPPEISGLVGHRLTVVVKIIPNKSINAKDDDPTFDILNIKKRPGKDSMAWTFKKEHTPVILANSFSQHANLPPLVPIESKKEENQSSSSHKYSPQDIQYMEIDQTSALDDINISNKRAFEGNEDSDKDISDDSRPNSQLLKKGKRSRA